MSFPAYTTYKKSDVEWLGEVPEHWILTPLKHLALLNPRKSGYDGDTEQLCSFVPMEKLKTGVVQLDEERPIAEVIGGYTYFEDGDVLQAKVTPCFENKNIAIAKGLTNGIGFGSSEINVLRPYQGVNAEYLYYRVQEDSYMDFCTSSMIGAGGLKRVPTDVINNFKVATPEVFEQTQIARFLDHETARIDALIEEQQRLIELLKEKRQAVISHAVTKGLDPTMPMKDSGVEWLGEVPAHWERKRLKNISPFITVGIVVNPSDYVAEEGLPFIYGGEVKEGLIEVDKARKISLEDSLRNRKTMLEAGDIVTMRVGYPGLTAVVPPDCEGGNCASVMLVKRGGFDSRWLCAVMNSRLVRQQVEVVQYGAAQKQFNIADAIEFWMFKPPFSEQTTIAEFVEEQSSIFDELMAESENSMALLQERRSALISAAVTGKIDVRGWQPPAPAPAENDTVEKAGLSV
jgi:type I restriction enzyme S subunit